MLIEQIVYCQLKCMLQSLDCVFHLKNILSLHRMSLQICRNLINGMLLFQIFNCYNVTHDLYFPLHLLFRALQADVLLLNEIGLDPGIDHCSAADLVQRLKGQNKEIVSFTSFCGGLPSPDDSLAPLRYKFSWRPHGVLTAALNSARYLLNEKVSYCNYAVDS
jgi:hypothetical protein